VLLGAGAGILAVGAAGAGYGAGRTGQTTPSVSMGPTSIPSAGLHQAGIVLPAIAQRTCLVAVADVDVAALPGSLAALGQAIARVTNAHDPVVAVTPDGPGDLTATVGLGPRALAATGHPELAGTVQLPAFRGDVALAAGRQGGDLLLTVNSSDPMVLEPVLTYLTSAVSGFLPRWSEFGFRGPADQGVTRNPLGYYDGIIVPRTPDDIAQDVWVSTGPLAGGTVCVIRRFRLDVDRFRGLPEQIQDQTIGRHRGDGSPLSGGTRFSQINLEAKTDTGDLLVPAHAHARAAHPAFTGSRLMLRRSYSYRASAQDRGHLFISYQNDVRTFSRTQLRLDDTDDLMKYVTPTATAAFAVLPGVVDGDGRARPLGATLF
jgi:dye decolorizing peroxidase